MNCESMNGKYVLIFFIAAFSLGLTLSYIDGHLELLEILRSFAVALGISAVFGFYSRLRKK
ncbi:MAG: hypothetical protein QFX40_02285 [Archaeoglobales archaeon]|nr:hypothetical protein [Archaeoglobales archaeon]